MKPWPLDLGTPRQATIDHFLAKGVPALSLVNPAPLRTALGEIGADGRFDPNPAGSPHVVFEEPQDLVFWQPQTGRLGTWEGECFALGEDRIDGAEYYALGRSLRIFRDPLSWLQGNRAGIVIVDWDRTFDTLRFVSAVHVDEALRATFTQAMKPRRMPKITFEPEAEKRAAA